MSAKDFSWAIPLMRAGYAGRGIVYLAIAGISLWAIWSGGSAQGTSSTFARLEHSGWGIAVLLLIALGMVCYAAWRMLDATYDLEDYGNDAKGFVARGGQITTGLIHGAIGLAALATVLAGSVTGDGESAIATATRWVKSLPAGIWLVGIAGALTISAGLYYAAKAWNESYRDHVIGNEVTARWNWVLKAGVLSQAVIVTIIGGFLFYAAMTADPNQAGGLGQAFGWLRDKAYGQILVVLVCLGLIAFAVFCFMNARYRIVPRATAGDVGVTSLKQKLRTA
ncbi:DUF1206 domain-containing protein [Ovoidimarina sediminis]|uniref:DUF1206 domain-containing protein n=1 Tax=Ovoidimarina sediminis TaxID=3079856 RepID=UPI00290DBB9E|nr:DUF1206 domain-containing protein [Rhodophyticola sp. MJ-SS7]MDU8941920.1 DUF1206 domain-containing protein [Rhodophyticola sp. MJ-SS7]